MAATPRSLAARLAQYITDDAAIIAHVKRDFGVTYGVKDIRRIRSNMPVKVERGQIVALAHTDRVVKVEDGDPLLKGLAKYHLAHSNLQPHEAAYYERIAG
jgi:precorrin-6B methylase 1